MNKNNIVVYENKMNKVSFRDFTSVEMDLFFTICSQMREKGVGKISFTFDQLKDISEYTSRSIDRFVNDLESTYKKMLKLTFSEKTNNGKEEEIIRHFVLFTGFEINKSSKIVTISTNPDFGYILNSITKEFTKFELEEFLSLKSNYSKTLYRLLKQFKKTGYFIISIEDFRELFSVPEKFRMSEISKWILGPIEKELALYYDKFHINKIKIAKSSKVVKLEFIFTPEHDFLTDEKNDEKVTFRNKDGEYYKIKKKNVGILDEEYEKIYGKEVTPLSEIIEKEKYIEEKKKKEKEEKKKKLDEAIQQSFI